MTAFIADLVNTVVGTTAVGLNGVREDVRSKETNIGNLITDAYLNVARAEAANFGVQQPEVAFVNGGGIRNNDVRGPGNITASDTFDILPFGNLVSIIEDVSPETLKAALENGVSRANPDETSGTGRFLQMAGMTIVYDPTAAPRAFDADGNVTAEGSRIQEATLADGTTIVEGGVIAATARPVTIALPSFTAAGGDQHPFEAADATVGLTGQQALTRFIQSADGLAGNVPGGGPYEPGGENRITRLGS